ncbi:DNA primase small subunit [Anaeramoeba ignava]|uniref:DNA primase n=1 Tax=Anaeramoeba ignava TaxID=1746090 RepID=A0A9Q0R6A6_ANAIG|nr:DNA primase small subunit [Anaeramoeba ignava]
MIEFNQNLKKPRTEEEIQKENQDKTQNLKIYYDYFFPFQQIFEWLSYGNLDFFHFREFSFLSSNIIRRFVSFENVTEFQRYVSMNIPQKIDYGAIYNYPPNKRNEITEFQPKKKELIFDIDITDYDDCRTCCSGTNICNKCWIFLVVAIKTLEYILRNQFAFRNILWVFSGRRGVHCWVCDKTVLDSSDSLRKNIVNFIFFENDEKKPLTPNQLEIYNEILEPYFKKVIETQELFEKPENWQKVLKFVKEEEIQKKIEKDFEQLPDSKSRYEYLQTMDYSKILPQIIFGVIYPRLDINVSKTMNHLLKSPFCIHPSTQQVCVPIDPQKCEDFDLKLVPQLNNLVDEFNEKGINSIPQSKFLNYYIKKLFIQDFLDKLK